jgi:hypothetical protein
MTCWDVHACASEERGDGEGIDSQALCACVSEERGDGEGAGSHCNHFHQQDRPLPGSTR